MAGRHAAAPSPERRHAWTILGVGTAVSLASVFGGAWVVRAGVIIAVAMAFLAVYVAWRQLDRERREHRSQIKEQIALRTVLTERYHAESMAMIDRFSARSENLKSLISNLRRQLAQANAELSSMRGNAVWLRAEIAERQVTIDLLSARVAELDVDGTGPQAALSEVAALQPNASDIWRTDEHPTVVNLQKLTAEGLPELSLEA